MDMIIVIKIVVVVVTIIQTLKKIFITIQQKCAISIVFPENIGKKKRMIVYLLSSQHEFKITKTKVYSSIESIVREQINSPYWKYLDEKPRIYKCEVDSNNIISLLSVKEWRKALLIFKEKYPNEIAKLELLK